MSKVVLVCVNVIGMVDVFDFCIMEVKVSCNIFINLMLYILFEDEFILLKLFILCLNIILKGY